MDKVSLKAVQADAHYRGTFQEYAFGLLANPIPLYRSLLKHLGPYGARLEQLRLDVGTIADAQLTCSLWDLGSVLNFRLDRLEVNHLRLHQMKDTAMPVVTASWAAIQDADGTVLLASHVVSLNITANVQGASYQSVIKRYVIAPEHFGPKARASVMFYLPVDGPCRGGTLAIDQVGNSDDRLVIRLILGFDPVPLLELEPLIDRVVTSNMGGIGLAFDK